MIKEKLKLVPHKPGCYLMKNNKGIIIYIGKAKDLKNRLSTYFNGSHTGKTAMLVRDIETFDYIVVDSELESLVLEINLIKKHKPRYNIMYMDDKSYPYILLTNEKYPRLLSIKKNNMKARGKLFGPYPNTYASKRVVSLLNRIYPLRKCKILPKKKCLYYHIGQCLGYCEENIEQSVIDNMKEEIIKFLNGNYKGVKEKIEIKMHDASKSMNYELALLYKQDLEYIDEVLNKQKVETKGNTNRDVFDYYINNGYISICVLHIRNGKIINTTKNIFPVIDTEEEELIGYISTFYEERTLSKEIIVPNNIDYNLLSEHLNIKVYSAQKGIKANLLNMAKNNAKIYLEEKFELIKRDEDKTINAMEELSNILNIPNLRKIEVFDNSNLFGSFSVSGMVTFIDGKPSKNDYRKYKISLEKNDDYNMMKEVIYRRYFKVLKDKLDKPDIIIVDGGVSQINAAREVLEDLNLQIPVFGLAKNDKHKTSDLIGFYPTRKIEIDRHSNVFHLLNRIQDEVHRWTITYHKNIRSKGSLSSLLDNIEGIGPTRKKELLKKYKSLRNMKEISIEEFQSILPEKVAKELHVFLKEYKKEKR